MLLNQVEVGDGQAGGDGRGQRRSPCHPGPGWAEQEDPVQASLSLQDLPALGLADPAVAPERGDVVGALGRSTGFGETKDNCTWSAIARTRRVAPGHQRHDYTSQGFIRMMASTFQLPPNLFSSITVYKINRLQGIISLPTGRRKEVISTLTEVTLAQCDGVYTPALRPRREGEPPAAQREEGEMERRVRAGEGSQCS